MMTGFHGSQIQITNKKNTTICTKSRYYNAKNFIQMRSFSSFRWVMNSLPIVIFKLKPTVSLHIYIIETNHVLCLYSEFTYSVYYIIISVLIVSQITEAMSYSEFRLIDLTFKYVNKISRELLEK